MASDRPSTIHPSEGDVTIPGTGPEGSADEPGGEALDATMGMAEGNPDRPAPGTTLGRYVLVDHLGRGGMGEVFRAFDPELSRLVALKCVRVDRAGRADAEPRLLVEARAIAQISHPNVVAVHDVGTAHTGQAFIAMELVDGPSLREWLHPSGRERPAAGRILEIFLRAGRGLAAAHEQGVIHRDFKPENVLLTSTGVPKVVDFGLAKPAAAPLLDPATRAAVRSASDGDGPSVEVRDGRRPNDGSDAASAEPLEHRLHAGLTRSGARLGTPAYMSPEQWSGEETTARADQFSFAVTLWEGLYGELPFAGSTIDAYAFHVLDGDVRPPPRDTDVPPHLQTVLRRALEVDPSRRFPNMPAMLDELALDPRRRTRTLLGLSLATVAAVGLAAGGYVFARRSDDAELRACVASVEQQTSHWDAEARARVRGRLEASDRPFAAAVANEAIAGLDESLERWQAIALDACEAQRVPDLPEQAELEAARHLCLERAVLHHRDLTAGLERITPARLGYVAPAVDESRAAMDACTDPRALRALWRRRSATAEQPELVAALAPVSTALDLGDVEAARSMLETLPDPPADGGWPAPLYLDRMTAHARLELLDGAPVRAVELLDDAAGHLVGRPLPDRDRREFQALLARARYAAGDYEAMRHAYRRHYEMSVAMLGADAPATALAYGMQGHAAYASGQYTRALTFYREALERVQRVDPAASEVDDLTQWVAETQLSAGDAASARATLRPLLEAEREAHGAAHPRVLELGLIMGRCELALGEVDAANDRFARLLEARRADPVWRGSRDEVALLGNLGAALLMAERPKDATAHLETAIDLLEAGGAEEDDRFRVSIDANLGTALLDTDQPARAATVLDGAARRSEQLGESRTRNGLTIRRQLALALAHTGDRDRAARVLDALAADLELEPQPELELELWRARARVADLAHDEVGHRAALQRVRALERASPGVGERDGTRLADSSR